jgi:hypothetical protein
MLPTSRVSAAMLTPYDQRVLRALAMQIAAQGKRPGKG